MRTENKNDLISHKEEKIPIYNGVKKTVVKLAMENSNRSAAQ